VAVRQCAAVVGAAVSVAGCGSRVWQCVAVRAAMSQCVRGRIVCAQSAWQCTCASICLVAYGNAPRAVLCGIVRHMYVWQQCGSVMMMTMISPFGHKAVGDLSGRRDVFTSTAHVLRTLASVNPLR
jgi:hypothetical protein